MQRKTCFKCHVEKPVTDFYVHPQMGDGRLNKCKECTKIDVRKNYIANIDYYRAYEDSRMYEPHRVAARKRYVSSEAGKRARRRAAENYWTRNPEKRSAHVATRNAIRDGKLVCMPCEKCGAIKVDAHHDDYSKPLEVRWLCRKHHLEHHGKQQRQVS